MITTAFVVLAFLCGAAAQQTESCQLTESVSPWHRIFHDDSVCDRNAYTDFKNSMDRNTKHRSFMQTGNHAAVPNQRTRLCPRVVKDLGSSTASTVYGYDTTWFMKNEASTPVVIAVVKDGMEYSALNDKISPPQADPNAIVQPGDVKVVHTFEGHVFHVRNVYENGSTGNVLLQHRAGLVPIGVNAQQLACPSTDPEPMVEVHSSKSPEPVLVTHPDFTRKPVKQLKYCNMLEMGFRNLANCPLHAYWVAPQTCKETFTFHLGTNYQANDYQWDWDSVTKFEATFVGHQFVFRSTFSAQEVDRVTVLPTIVSDCPDLGEQVYETEHGLNVMERVWGLEGVNITKHGEEFVVDASSNTWKEQDAVEGLVNATSMAFLYATPGHVFSA